jgi:pepF/M3 family oligoendopeptidase
MSSIAPSPLPRWDLTSAFPSLDSPKYARAFEELVEKIRSFERLLDDCSTSKDSGSLEEVLQAYNTVARSATYMDSYIGCHVTVNTRDQEAQAKASELEAAVVPLTNLKARMSAWIGTLDLEAILAESQVARDHEYALRKIVEQARHLMSPEEESLLADLSPSASTAWEKLHGNITSQIEVPVEIDGQTRRISMSMARNLAYEPDRRTRQAAYEAELQAWKQNEVPIAAAMNSIKGHVSTVCRRRGWQSPLDEALFNANIDRQTLDAMLQAAREFFPDIRRYMHAKARALGVHRLAWFDIFAPLSAKTKEWPYEQAEEFVAEQFTSYSQRMGDFARQSFHERWIDAESRPGKVDGAYCTSFMHEQSRILLNYKTAFGSVSTLAHELGHGYHNLCLKGRTYLQRNTPMTLAETASIFCETVIENAALKNAGEAEQIAIVEASLQRVCQTVVDISSRFLFEQNVFNGRNNRELSAEEFCGLMLDAQRETYGDGLDPEFLHPYMWAVKPHYYSTYSFYNFPYMFGMLFARGLYAEFDKDREGFKGKYDELLGSTGLADAATLTERFGINIRTPEFWRSSLAKIKNDIDQFERLVR